MSNDCANNTANNFDINACADDDANDNIVNHNNNGKMQ